MSVRSISTFALFVFGVAVLCGCWIFLIRSDRIFWALLAFGLAAITGISGRIRIVACLMAALTVARGYSLSHAEYLYVLPDDFSGKITVVYHPHGTYKFQYAGFWTPRITIHIPPSGLIVTSDTTALHRLFSVEVWRYEDGRVIKEYYNRLAPGFAFVGSRGGRASGVAKDDPLFTWAVWKDDFYELRTMNYEVLREAMNPGEAEPGATDNPDDAQRLREDH